MRIHKRLIMVFGLYLMPLVQAQSVTTVEVYGDVPAIQAYNGLGTNITNTNSWEYVAAQAAHMTWGRYDCGWQGVEIQTGSNTSGGYAFPSYCSAGVTSGLTYGVHPVINADYGPPFFAMTTGTLTSGTSVGATTMTVTVSSGLPLSSIVPGQTEVLLSPQWSSKASYPGALIKGVSGSTLTMASAATNSFSSGTAVTINLLLYPPVLVPPGQGYKAYQANSSVQAYANYAHYMAAQIAAAGAKGQVSIWNEPPWPADSWDQAGNLYDTPPSNGYIESGSPGLGVELPLYLANLGTGVAGVPLDNGYTETVGLNGSLFYTNLVPYQQSLATMKSVFGSESFHPYGDNPEDPLWLGNACIYANLSNLTNLLNNCTPTGAVIGSAEKLAVAENFYANTFGGLPHEVTETGFCRCNSPTPTETSISRWNIRQFLGWQALGITPVMFYRLAGDTNWEWLHSDHSPYPVYTAFQGLMSDIGSIANSPVAPYSPCMMPRVSSFTGYYPLATLTFVGSQSGNNANSLLYYTWQRTYGAYWPTVTSPAAVNVSVVVPTGMTVSYVKDKIAGTSVSYTFTSGTLTYPVADNPIEALLVPTSSSIAATLTCT